MANPVTVTDSKLFLTLEEAKDWAKGLRKPRVTGRSVRILEKHVTGFGARQPIYMALVLNKGDAEGTTASTSEPTPASVATA